MKDTKVLVISHNAFSLTNNMGKTLYCLFGEFKRENIAQIYFHVLDSDVDICDTLFRITDRDVLRSIFLMKKCGIAITPKNGQEKRNVQVISKIYKYGQKRNPTKLILRDLMWRIGHWKSKDLFFWIDDYKPDAIFFAAGYSMFSINVAMYIASKYNIPLVTYFCDDYYDFTYSSSRYSLVSSTRMMLFRNKIKTLVDKSKELVFISESMMYKYEVVFNKKGQVIMTPNNINQLEQKPLNKPLIISFIGSVLSNRWRTLIKIGEALEKINCKDLKIVLNIYSVANDQEIISKLHNGNSMMFKGPADFEMVKKIFYESDIMLHVESFDPEDANRVRHSISTKIADCLACNRAFLAIGPGGIASIDYLKQNKVAYVIDDENRIENKLVEYFVENNIDEKIINNAISLAKKNHNLTANSERLKNIFDNIVKG